MPMITSNPQPSIWMRSCISSSIQGYGWVVAYVLGPIAMLIAY